MNEPKYETLMAKIIRHWQGNGRLSWAYWGFHFGGGLILFFVLAVGFLAILPFAYQDGVGVLQSRSFAVYLVVFGTCYLAHAIFSTVMIWRCGPNVGWRGWTLLSRALVIISIFNWVDVVGTTLAAL